jgi:hypothetical protein
MMASGSATALGGRTAERRLAGGFAVFTTRLPEWLDREARSRFEELWALHPERFHTITQPFTAGRSRCRDGSRPMAGIIATPAASIVPCRSRRS